MSKAKVLHNWYNASPLVISSIMKDTVTGMTGNANFTTPDVPLPTMDTAAIRIVNAWNNRENGDPGKVELVNAVNDGIDKLNKQADYVDTTVKGDRAKLVSSGFKATSDVKHPSVVPSQAAAAKINTLPGKLKLSTDKVEGADKYHYVLFVGGPGTVNIVDGQMKVSHGPQTTDVIIVPAGHLHEEISGIDPLQKVFVGVLAANAAGIAAMSPLVEAHTV